MRRVSRWHNRASTVPAMTLHRRRQKREVAILTLAAELIAHAREEWPNLTATLGHDRVAALAVEIARQDTDR